MGWVSLFFGFVSAGVSAFILAFANADPPIIGPQDDVGSAFFFMGLFLASVATGLIALTIGIGTLIRPSARRERTAAVAGIVTGLSPLVIIALAIVTNFR